MVGVCEIVIIINPVQYTIHVPLHTRTHTHLHYTDYNRSIFQKIS